MKLNNKKYLVAAAMALSFGGYIMSCTKGNQVLDVPVANNATDLLCYKTTTAPVLDGTVDAIWANATKLQATPVVPDPGNGLFAGYQGEAVPVTLRSMYDNQYIYFLAEWNDNTHNQVQPWYYNPTTKRWAQRGNARTFDANGALIKDGMGQDQLAMLWNIDNSTAKFASQTCYASCHLFTPYRNFLGQMVANKSGNHYTNGANEKIDMWWCRMDKDLLTNQMDDNYQDWAGGPSTTDTVGGSGNGRHADDLTPPTPFSTTYTNNNTTGTTGAFNNSQSIKITGTTTSVSVPKWVDPIATNQKYYLATDTLAGGRCQLVTAVDSNGILTLSTGATINPIGDAGYADDATTGVAVGAKCFPSFISAPLTAGRADISASGIYTGTGWILEFKRLLKTANPYKQDIDFTANANTTTGKYQDQPFGLAIFDSRNYQHAIKPNLNLKFQ